MKLKLLYLAIGVVLVAACNKTWEEEAGIRIFYNMPPSVDTLAEQLTVDSATLSLVACTFRSARRQSSDVTKDIIFEKAVHLSGTSGDDMTTLGTMNIPQGTYYSPRITFLLSDNHGLAVFGSYTSDDDTWPWVMTFDSFDQLTPLGLNNDEWDAVAGRSNEIHFRLNPYAGLSSMDMDLFKHANITVVSGVPTIEINAKKNVAIFELLKSAIESETILDFK